MKITVPIPALTGGVSSQPEPVRLPQQADRSDNFIATVVEGLRTRPPTEWVSGLPWHPTTPCAYHNINQVGEDYLIVANSGTLKVVNLNDPDQEVLIRNTDGAPLTSGDLTYLSNVQDPQTDIQFLTVEDYTLILNRRQVVQDLEELSVLTPAQPSRGLVFVKGAAYNTNYVVEILHNNTTFRYEYRTLGATNTPAATAEAEAKTDQIALRLSQLMTLGGAAPLPTGVIASSTGILNAADWRVTVSGSVISVERIDGSEFSMSTRDGEGNTLISTIHKEVQLFSDLPTRAPNGMVIKILGDPTDPDAAFWAKFVVDVAAAGAFGEGSWEESVAPRISQGMVRRTMPHALIRQSNGEWRYAVLNGNSYIVSGQEQTLEAWSLREVGDDTSNQHPRFVGRTINSLCYHEGRLGLLTDDAICFSESGNPWNFYRTTVVDVLDSERIELRGRGEVEKMSHAIPIGADVMIFAEDSQLVVRSDGPLTPTSASLILAGRYDSDPDVRPLIVRDSVFVASSRAGKGAIHEFRLVGDQRPEIQQMDVTAIASSYVPLISQMATTSQLDTVVCVTQDDPEYLYVYTHYWQGQEKVAQAWQRFILSDSPEILNVWFDETVLWLVARYSDGVRLLKMRLGNFEGDGSNGFVNLDCRIDNLNLVRVYDGKQTAFVMPFAVSENTAAINQRDFKSVRVNSAIGNVLILAGDQRSQRLWIGGLYDVRHDMSRAYVAGRDSAPIMSEDLYLDGGVIYYDRSGPFQVHVVNDYGPSWVTEFGGPGLGAGANFQTVRPTSGRFPFGVRSKADSCRISFRARQPWPVRLISMDIYGRLNRSRGQRP